MSNAIDITGHLSTIFSFFGDVLRFLNGLTFTAFGFEFSYLGIFVSFIFLVFLVKFLKFGIEESVSSSIKYKREENSKSYMPRHSEDRPRHAYLPRHQK